MSAGVLIYCFDTDKIKYHLTTNFCIKQIKQHLSLPVTVVTNLATKDYIQGADSFEIIENKKGNKRFYKGEIIDWFNLERSNAYEYSPYDITILLDSDYFVYTDNLLQLLDSKYDFLLHNKVFDLTGRSTFEYKNKSLIDLVWATVTIFKKNSKTKKIFDLIKHIQNNYQYFCNLYRIDFKNYRNDYAFAIALHQLNIKDFIPIKMSMLPADANIMEIDSYNIKFRWLNSFGTLQKQDVHVLNKEIPFNV